MTEKLDAAKLLEGTTPGNWLAAGGPSSVVGWPIVASPSGRSIAGITWRPGLPAELEAEIGANARLIAAAPDLARENIALREAMGRMREVMDRTPELNMSNYDIDDIAALNNGMIEIWQILNEPALKLSEEM
jgi:hypothetical protein